MSCALPDTIRIIGQDYHLFWMSDALADASECLGTVDHEKLVIHIKKSLPSGRIAEIVLHEIFHCLLYAMHSQEEPNEEPAVDRLGRSFSCLMRDNPKLFKQLLAIQNKL